MTKNMRFQKNMTKNIVIFSALLRLRDMMLIHFPHIELHIDPHVIFLKYGEKYGISI